MAKIFLYILAILFLLFVPTCSDENTTKNILSNRGYTDIQIVDKEWWDCDYGDSYSTRFTAKIGQNHKVKGSVCDGWFRDEAIIKFDN